MVVKEQAPAVINSLSTQKKSDKSSYFLFFVSGVVGSSPRVQLPSQRRDSEDGAQVLFRVSGATPDGKRDKQVWQQQHPFL